MATEPKNQRGLQDKEQKKRVRIFFMNFWEMRSNQAREPADSISDTYSQTGDGSVQKPTAAFTHKVPPTLASAGKAVQVWPGPTSCLTFPSIPPPPSRSCLLQGALRSRM